MSLVPSRQCLDKGVLWCRRVFPLLGWGCPCPWERGGSEMMEAVSPQEPSLYTVKAVIILDNDGDRLFAKVRGPRG